MPRVESAATALRVAAHEPEQLLARRNHWQIFGDGWYCNIVCGLLFRPNPFFLFVPIVVVWGAGAGAGGR